MMERRKALWRDLLRVGRVLRDLDAMTTFGEADYRVWEVYGVMKELKREIEKELKEDKTNDAT